MKSADASLSLKAPRILSENSQTGIWLRTRNESGWRMIFSDAMSKRERLMPLFARYSAFSASRSASAADNSPVASSWNSVSMIVMMAIDPSTRTSATPRCFFLFAFIGTPRS
jgi:hypothetical protein